MLLFCACYKLSQKINTCQRSAASFFAAAKRIRTDEWLVAWLIDTTDKSSRHAPSCRPLFKISRDSRWTAHGMCLLL
jgi:hypothetical protein